MEGFQEKRIFATAPLQSRLCKNDKLDAQMLARLARMDPGLLRPIRHRSEEAQKDLMTIRVRSALVEARTGLVNAARGLTRASGERLASCDADQMNVGKLEELPAELRESLKPLIKEVESLTEKIKECDRKIEQIACDRYPETKLLRQVSGVGPLIALTYILTIEDKERFKKEPGRGMLRRPASEAERVGRATAGAADHQRRRCLSAQAAGAGSTLHYGEASAGYGPETVGNGTSGPRQKEREEKSDRGGGQKTGDPAASFMGDR